MTAHSFPAAFEAARAGCWPPAPNDGQPSSAHAALQRARLPLTAHVTIRRRWQPAHGQADPARRRRTFASASPSRYQHCTRGTAMLPPAGHHQELTNSCEAHCTVNPSHAVNSCTLYISHESGKKLVVSPTFT